jgi:hypothetical protein
MGTPIGDVHADKTWAERICIRTIVPDWLKNLAGLQRPVRFDLLRTILSH